MRPIAPRTGHPESTIAEEQTEHLPITVAIAPIEEREGYGLILRYTFTPEERKRIADGEDVYFCQLYYAPAPMTPVQARVGPGDWKRDEQ